MKREVKASFIDTNLEKGKSAFIIVNGRWVKTSPVVSFFIGGGQAIVETENTVYKTR